MNPAPQPREHPGWEGRRLGSSAGAAVVFVKQGLVPTRVASSRLRPTNRRLPTTNRRLPTSSRDAEPRLSRADWPRDVGNRLVELGRCAADARGVFAMGKLLSERRSFEVLAVFERGVRTGGGGPSRALYVREDGARSGQDSCRDRNSPGPLSRGGCDGHDGERAGPCRHGSGPFPARASTASPSSERTSRRITSPPHRVHFRRSVPVSRS